jgi:ribosomal protein S27AE
MRAAISYATTEWGGISQPIVPVRKGGAIDGLWRQVCSTLEVEVLIDYGGLARDLKSRIEDTLSATIIDPTHFDPGPEPGIHTMVAIDPGSLDRFGLLTAGADASLLEAAAIGTIPPSQEDIWAQSGSVLVRDFSENALLGAQLSNQGCSIGLTWEQLPTFQAEGWFQGAFIIFSYNRFSVRRALFFWNMRALCNRFGSDPDRVVLLPSRAFRDAETMERLKYFLMHKKRTTPNFILVSENAKAARAIGISGGFKEAPDKKLNWPLFGEVEQDSFDPLTFLPNIHPAEFLLGRRRQGKTRDVALSVARPKSTLYVESPTTFNTSIGGNIRVDVRGVSAWAWPRSNQVAKLISPNAIAVDEGISLLASPSSTYRFDLAVPDPADVCTAFLEGRGWSWSYSDKGKYASALIATHGLERLMPLSRKSSLDVVAALASTSRPKAEQLLERAVGDAVDPKELDRIVSRILPYGVRRWLTANELAGDLQIRKHSLLPVLSDLLELGLVERALNFDCDTCGLNTFVPLADAKDRLRCPGCGSEHPLVGPSRAEPIWAYALNSLLDRTWDQNCLDHVLLTRWLSANGRIVWAVPGADVKGPNSEREVDVLALSHAELQVAEMKPPHAFTDEVIRGRIHLAKALGARRLILASLEPWSVEDIERAQKRSSEQLFVEVLDGSSLVT